MIYWGGKKMKMYGVKEIEEYTGLSRKDLFVYEKSIPPVERKDNAGFNAKGKEHKGYKLYDQLKKKIRELKKKGEDQQETQNLIKSINEELEENLIKTMCLTS